MSAAATVPVPAPEHAGVDISRPVPFLRGARTVFDLALEAMLWSRRTLFMAILLFVPVFLSVLYRVLLAARLPARISGVDFYAGAIGFFYLRHALPLVALFYASALIADEVEARTITYLLTRPVRRAAILFGKFAAYVATTLALAMPAVVMTFFLLHTQRGRHSVSAGAPDLVRDLGVVALTMLAYGALFTVLGVLLKRPLLPGLMFLYGWETLAKLPGWAPRLTLTAWLRSLVRHRPSGEGIGEALTQLPAPLSLGVLAAIIVVCLALAGWIFARRQYVLEQ